MIRDFFTLISKVIDGFPNIFIRCNPSERVCIKNREKELFVEHSPKNDDSFTLLRNPIVRGVY